MLIENPVSTRDRAERRTHKNCGTSLKGLDANGKKSVKPKWPRGHKATPSRAGGTPLEGVETSGAVEPA